MVALGGGAALWVGEDRTRARERLAAVLGALAVALAVLGLVDGSAVSLDLLGPLREGGTDVQVRVARGEGVEIGQVYTHLWLPLLAGFGRSLGDVVRVDAALGLATLVLVAPRLLAASPAAVRSSLAPLGPLLLGLAWVRAVPVWDGVLGGGPGPGIWLLLLAGGHALATLGGAPGLPRRAAALLVAAVAWGLAALHRVELLVLPSAWLAVEGAARTGLADAVRTSVRARPRRWGVGAALVLGLALLSWGPVAGAIGRAGRVGWVLQALHPLDLSPVTVPLAAMAAMSPALVVLGVRGMLRDPVSTGGLGLGAVLLARIHHAAAHGGWWGSGDLVWPLELARYASYTAPVLLLLVLWGWEALSPRARRLAMIGLLCPPLPWIWLPRHEGKAGPAPWDVIVRVDTDAAQEVRALLAGQRLHPTCGFVAPGDVDAEGRRSWFAWRATDGITRRDARRFVVLRDVAGPEEAAAAVPGDPGCVLLYTGMGCAVAGDCGRWTEGLAIAWTEPHRAHPHAHPDHGWDPPGSWVSTWWVLRGTPPAP
ncbi:MAG: hypothetical protein H6732_11830 [Alphaproteobacteria bacterium]|nr:hypothetical protein [Alphaproteobacteria bacterium]